MKDQENFSAVALQFRFPSLDAIPPTLRKLMRQPEARNTSLPPGKLIIEQTEGVSLELFRRNLEANDLMLVDACCEERRNSIGPGKHYMVRFVFSRTDKPSERFGKFRTFARVDLTTICTSALWRAHVYDNTLADGKRGASVVLNARNPFIQGDGQQAVVWKKDPVTGEHIGDAPIPLKPSHFLRFVKETPTLLSVAG